MKIEKILKHHLLHMKNVPNVINEYTHASFKLYFELYFRIATNNVNF